jgi:HK97 family phage major capsid protein
MPSKVLAERLRATLIKARDIADTAEKADRAMTEDEKAQVTTLLKEAGDLKAQVDDLNEVRKSLSDLDGIELNDKKNVGVGAVDPSGLIVARGKSIGQCFTDSENYKTLLSGVPDGGFRKGQRVHMDPVGFKDLVTGSSPELLGEATDSGGIFVTPDRRGLQDPTYARDLKLRQLLSPGTTDSDTIEYPVFKSVTNNAAPVREASSSATDGSVTPATSGNPGGYKPESGLDFEMRRDHVRTIAHWIPVTKKALADAGQIRTLIDNFLRYGLEEELEDQIISGSGTGEEFLGLESLNDTQDGDSVVQAGDDEFDIARRAKRLSRQSRGGAPTAYVMNPEDWERYDLKRDGVERYYGNGPFGVSTPTLWGLPVIESEGVDPGRAWVANWRRGVLYDRQQAAIQATDSHDDFFVRNLVAILAELRAGLAFTFPQSFVHFSTQGSSS